MQMGLNICMITEFRQHCNLQLGSTCIELTKKLLQFLLHRCGVLRGRIAAQGEELKFMQVNVGDTAPDKVRSAIIANFSAHTYVADDGRCIQE
jgi:hypothetical protein